MSEQDKCRYMEAAYPTLSYQDACGFGAHRHDETTFALARALAVVCQKPDPSDEQIGWFLEDAAAVIEEFERHGDAPTIWEVSALRDQPEIGLNFAFTANGVEFILPESEWEPAHPVPMTTWREWHAEEEADDE